MRRLIVVGFGLLIAAMAAIMLLPLESATWTAWALIIAAGVCILVAWLVVRRRSRRLH
jgi:O-antigen/teichoic acid export membrane protein